MRAAVFQAVHEVALFERQRPSPKSGEALVAVRAAALCAGDLYIYTGKNPYVSYPRIGGHEIAGEVVALGPDTRGPAPGSGVVVEPFLGLRPLLSLPGRQVELLRERADHRRAPRRRLRRFRRGAR
jgi:L-gulonate 5-dehydrogenase